jgi:hypothetical protein
VGRFLGWRSALKVGRPENREAMERSADQRETLVAPASVPSTGKSVAAMTQRGKRLRQNAAGVGLVRPSSDPGRAAIPDRRSQPKNTVISAAYGVLFSLFGRVARAIPSHLIRTLSRDSVPDIS